MHFRLAKTVQFSSKVAKGQPRKALAVTSHERPINLNRRLESDSCPAEAVEIGKRASEWWLLSAG